jgi:hypothetical protein
MEFISAKNRPMGFICPLYIFGSSINTTLLDILKIFLKVEAINILRVIFIGKLKFTANYLISIKY